MNSLGAVVVAVTSFVTGVTANVFTNKSDEGRKKQVGQALVKIDKGQSTQLRRFVDTDRTVQRAADSRRAASLHLQSSLEDNAGKLRQLHLIKILQVCVPLGLEVMEQVGSICSTDYKELHFERTFANHKQVSNSMARLGHFKWTKKDVDCKVELLELVVSYARLIEEGTAIIYDYNRANNLGDWWNNDQVRKRLADLCERYDRFLQAFQVVIQVDTRLAMDAGFDTVVKEVEKNRAAVDSWGLQLQGDVGELKTEIKGMDRRLEGRLAKIEGMLEKLLSSVDDAGEDAS